MSADARALLLRSLQKDFNAELATVTDKSLARDMRADFAQLTYGLKK